MVLTKSRAKAATTALAITEARQIAVSGAGQMIRTAAGLSLREFGAAVGVDASTVLRWEEGTRRPSGQNAIAYRSFLRQLSAVRAAPLPRGTRRRKAAGTAVLSRGGGA